MWDSGKKVAPTVIMSYAIVLQLVDTCQCQCQRKFTQLINVKPPMRCMS